jgi:hypothetical protein
MDERRASPRRRGTGAGLLTTAGLAGLGLATLATAALAGAGLQNDPLGAVATTRLIPELVVAAVVVTALVGLTLWVLVPAAPTRSRSTTSRHALWPRLAGMVAGFALIGLLLTLVHRLDDRDEDPAPETTPTPESTESRLDTPDESAAARSGSGSPVVHLAIAIGGVGAVLLLGAAAVRAAVSHHPPPHTLDDDPIVGTGSGPPPGPVLARQLETIDRRLADEQDPRLAVIEAYWSLERAMGAAGLPPTPAETSSEFLARCLEPLGPGADAARHLTQLFEWAMFSRRPMDENTRADAVQALRTAIAALGVGPTRTAENR